MQRDAASACAAVGEDKCLDPSGAEGRPDRGLLLWRRTYLFPRFMDDDRANHIVRIAEKRLAPSGLAYRRGDSEKNSRRAFTAPPPVGHHIDEFAG